VFISKRFLWSGPHVRVYFQHAVITWVCLYTYISYIYYIIMRTFRSLLLLRFFYVASFFCPPPPPWPTHRLQRSPSLYDITPIYGAYIYIQRSHCSGYWYRLGYTYTHQILLYNNVFPRAFPLVSFVCSTFLGVYIHAGNIIYCTIISRICDIYIYTPRRIIIYYTYIYIYTGVVNGIDPRTVCFPVPWGRVSSESVPRLI